MKRTVADLMTPEPTTVGVEATLNEVRHAMNSLRVRHIPVVDDEDILLGVISLSDLIQYMKPEVNRVTRDEDPMDVITAGEVMAKVISAVPHWTVLSVAARRLLSEKRSSLPIVDAHNKLVGILTESDFVRVVAEMLEADEAMEDEFTEPMRRRP